MAEPRLITARVRMYQVGFGDCFLLTFGYDGTLPDGRNERQVLIDFGSKRLFASGNGLVPIAKKVAKHAGGKLDAVVVTHRHQDHLSALGQPAITDLLTANGTPSLVVRPWTEEPGLAEDAPAPAPGPGVRPPGHPGSRNAPDESGPGDESRAFARTLESAGRFAANLAAAIPKDPNLQVVDRLGMMATGEVSNPDAVHRLEAWSDQGRGRYVFYGAPSGLEEVVPGLKVKVLGPPTIEQHSAVRTMTDSDPEFWMLYARRLDEAGLLNLFASATNALGPQTGGPNGDGVSPDLASEALAPGAAAVPIGPVRWLIDKMSRQQFNALLRIVRIMDDVLNNTSIILLFEMEAVDGPARMLFPGDAQLENWEYALKVAEDKDANLEALSRIDLYKVGHHGSRNATPRTLFNLWMRPENLARPLAVLMSTKYHVFDDSEATAVPRDTLVTALKERARTFRTTSDLDTLDGFYEVSADLRIGAEFHSVEPNI
jgi:hypothetical protein